jgi:hypothetical protein
VGLSRVARGFDSQVFLSVISVLVDWFDSGVDMASVISCDFKLEFAF